MTVPPPNVVAFPTSIEPPTSGAFEKLWGKRIKNHGFAAIPTIMVRAQHRLGVNPTQFCIMVQLLEYWRPPERAPFPTKQQLADRIGVSQSTIQTNMRAGEGRLGQAAGPPDRVGRLGSQHLPSLRSGHPAGSA